MDRLSVTFGVPGLIQFTWESRDEFDTSEALGKTREYFGTVRNIFGFNQEEIEPGEYAYRWYVERDSDDF